MNNQQGNEFPHSSSGSSDLHYSNLGQGEEFFSKPRFYVGIGASAGGLESLEVFFRNVRADSGFSYIVVQHLPPAFKSMMAELLARETSIRVKLAEEGDSLERDTIYLIPPGKKMIVEMGRLRLSDRESNKSVALLIDEFLYSLAADKGRRAIAVILSGSGSDGSRGIAAVHNNGGLVIAESLETARFDGMPSSAQATGLVDLVLPPHEIPHALANYDGDPRSLASKSTIPFTSTANRAETGEVSNLAPIFEMFRTSYQLDFSSYKEATVLRRIRRRMDLVGVTTYEHYIHHLSQHPSELHALYRDLLIGVTQFFRDPEVFRYLIQHEFPKMIARREAEGECLRVWIAGCATGEEAYTIAICLREAMRFCKLSVPVKLFATDVHRQSIDFASRGIFSSDIEEHLHPDFVKNYFVPSGEKLQISSEIRKLIVFSPHNVLNDTPFTDLDFVSCRNLLIYFRPQAQNRAVSLFHYGLQVGGLLLLGGSESTGELSVEFEPIHEKYRVYRKIRSVQLVRNLRTPLLAAQTMKQPAKRLENRGMAPSKNSESLVRRLAERFMPPSILVDAQRNVIETFAGGEKLLHFPREKPTMDVLDLVQAEFRTQLAGAILRSLRDGVAVSFSQIEVREADESRYWSLSVEPIDRTDSSDSQSRHLLISLSPNLNSISQVDESQAVPIEMVEIDASHEQILQLRTDLKTSRDNLEASIEELQASNEELQSTNEELLASNEQLKSANEELHSLNEELYSVNAELQRKIQELAELNRDMNLLLENTNTATIFLDKNLHIRRFTSQVSRVFDLLPSDVGRSIETFASNLPIENLAGQLKCVAETGRPIEQEILDVNGTSYLMKLLPYSIDGQLSGVVMMWVDVSSLEALRGRLRWMSAIVESTSDAIIGQDLGGIITSWNRGAELLYGYTAEEAIGERIDLLVPRDRNFEVMEYRNCVLRGEIVSSVDTKRVRRDGSTIDVSLTVSPVFDDTGRVIGLSKIARDISKRVLLEQQVRRQSEQRERFLAVLSHELRNPLNAVSAASAVLVDARAEETAKQSAALAIHRQVAIMNHLLADLLDVVRIAQNKIELKLEPIDLRNLIRAVQEMMASELESRGSSLALQLPGSPLVIIGDQTRLIQILVNLIQNAAKYSGSSSPIEVRLECFDEQVHISIVDHGRGIPRENLESIFEPFIQLDSGRHRSDGGLGIGLSLAKLLVELHEGKIYAESDGLGTGSSFHIWLPKHTSEQEDLNQKANSEDHLNQTDSCSSETEQPEETSELQVLKIAVVEDVDESREMLQVLLELDGHQVVVAESGRQAIEILERELPDLALVDIGLPDISGYEIAKHLRASETASELFLVALTGYGQPSDVAQAEQCGFNQHLVKPVLREQLTTVVREAQNRKAIGKSISKSSGIAR